MTIYHDDLIINLDKAHPEIFYVEHKRSKSQGYYKRMTSKKVKDARITIYRLHIPDLWLPAFITITETESDFVINHTRNTL